MSNDKALRPGCAVFSQLGGPNSDFRPVAQTHVADWLCYALDFAPRFAEPANPPAKTISTMPSVMTRLGRVEKNR